MYIYIYTYVHTHTYIYIYDPPPPNGSSPPPPRVVWCGGGLGCFPPACPGVWQTHAHDDIDDDDDDDNHDHHYHNHLSVSLVGRRVSSAHVPADADDYRFIDRGGTIFVTVVALGQSE